MRIIAGINKGKRLKAPRGLSIRPTLDKVKGAIFNIIGSRITDSSVLDLFSGTGALGIEALSRGASNCVFVDKKVRYIRENLKVSGFNGRIIKSDVRSAINQLDKDGFKFDIVIADPPYKWVGVKNLLSWLKESGILAFPNLVVIEHSRFTKINHKCVKEKYYGDTVVSVFSTEDKKRLSN